jgi:hypothetical protein
MYLENDACNKLSSHFILRYPIHVVRWTFVSLYSVMKTYKKPKHVAASLINILLVLPCCCCCVFNALITIWRTILQIRAATRVGVRLPCPSLTEIGVYSRILVKRNIKFHENKVTGSRRIDSKTEEADRHTFITSCCKRSKKEAFDIGHNKKMKFNVGS